MNTDIVYQTETHVADIRLTNYPCMSLNVIISGYVERRSRRRLFGIIPLPDRYVQSISVMLLTALGQPRFAVPWTAYTFDSQKRIAAKKAEIERILKLKCRQYGKRRS